MANHSSLILLSLLSTLGLSGCASLPYQEEPQVFQSVEIKTPLTQAVDQMARQLFQTKRYVTTQTPIAVTSFVDLAELDQTTVLGNQMSESFAHQLQANGLRVVEFKAPGYIKVTPKGDFALSRDYRDLKEQVPIDYILTGTYSKQSEGLLVNVKLFAAKSKIVVATAQGLVPKSVYEAPRPAQEPPRNTSRDSVRFENGGLVRSVPIHSVPSTQGTRPSPEKEEIAQ